MNNKHNMSADTSQKEKECFKCQVVKSVAEFSAAKRSKDGLSSYCKECRNRISRERYAKNRLSHLATSKKWRLSERGKASKRATRKRYKKRNPEKDLARQEVLNAIRRGTLVKEPCQECGEIRVEAHHPRGYDKEHWLDIQWLCRLHHLRIHQFILASTEEIMWSAPQKEVSE